MKIAVLKEQDNLENRVALSPDTVKKYSAAGFNVVVEKNAGERCGFTDSHFKDAGAHIAASPEKACEKADFVLKVGVPTKEEIALVPEGACLISTLNPYDTASEIKSYAKGKINAFAMELMPRITRAQSMDVLSSQSNLVGYKAVVDAASLSSRAFPLMMTAAGTVAPSRVLVLGAGVAGLQAIATAKRMGALPFAFDVRPEVKEQVESLGGKFVEVDGESGSTAAGYAKEMSDDYKKRQAAKIAEVIAASDIVIATALIPGKKAPILVTEDHVKSMKAGSIIIDIAAARGGNCALTQPGKIVDVGGVRIVGYDNYPSRIAQDASQLYARNLYNFITGVLVKDKKITINLEDEIVKGTLLTHEGKIIHPQFSGESKAPANNDKPKNKKAA